MKRSRLGGLGSFVRRGGDRDDGRGGNRFGNLFRCDAVSFSVGRIEAGEIGISGAINKTFKPQRVEAGRLASKIVVNLHERIWGGVWFRFPAESGPGTYAIEDQVTKLNPGVLAGFDESGADRGLYVSIQEL